MSNTVSLVSWNSASRHTCYITINKSPKLFEHDILINKNKFVFIIQPFLTLKIFYTYQYGIFNKFKQNKINKKNS